MRQVNYDFTPMQVLAAIVNSYISENGFWKFQIGTETLTGNFNGVFEGQRPEVLPGQIVRVGTFRVEQVAGPGPLTVERRNNEVLYATDRDQRGPEEGSGSVGEDSGHIGEGHPTPMAGGF